jgi:hypothetical protein
VLAAAAAGLLNAALWLGLVRTVVHADEPKRDKPLAPVAIIAVLALFLAGGGYAVTAGQVGEEPTERPPVPGGRPILFVAGFGTSYDGKPFTLFSSDELETWHYSYRGLGPDGPLAYDRTWTRQAVDVSAAKLATQIDWLTARTGRPVALIAASEGTLVRLSTSPVRPRSRTRSGWW